MKNHVSLSTLRVTLLLSIVLILHSCGSFQPTSQYATDGIYGSDQNSVKVSPSEVVSSNSGNTQFIDQDSNQYNWDDNVDGLYFTDTNSYVGGALNTTQGTLGQWGSNPQNTNIYFLGSPVDYNLGYLRFDPYFNNGFIFGNFNRGFFGNNASLYNPYRWGFYNPHFSSFPYAYFNPYFGNYYGFNGFNRFNGFNHFNQFNRNGNRIVNNRILPVRRARSKSRRGKDETNSNNVRGTRTSATSTRRGNINSRSNKVDVPTVISSGRNTANPEANKEERLREYARRYITSRQSNNATPPREIRSNLNSRANTNESNKRIRPSSSSSRSTTRSSAPSFNSSRSSSSNSSARSSSSSSRSSSRSVSSNRRN